MRCRVLAAALCLLAAAWTATGGQARAQEIPTAVIAVLDSQMVMRDSAAAKDIRRQIEAYRKAYQADIAGEEQALRQEEQDLKGQRAILSPQAFEERRLAFERRVIDVQRRVQDRMRQLDRSFERAMKDVRDALIPIVADLTTKMGVNVVVDKSQIMFATKALDITPQVIERLDQKLPGVEVPQPAN